MVQEDTNKVIAYNSIILCARLVVTLICGIFSTRFAFAALGVVDFGLISVVGGVIIFVGIVNSTMLGASNRFIAVAIGIGDKKLINETFNITLLIHVAIAIVTLLVALPIGHIYILNYVNYDGPISNAIMVYHISIIGSVLSFIGVPYNGLLMAREKFSVFCCTEMVFAIFKAIMTYFLVFYFTNKLLIYTLVVAFNTSAPTFIYYLYCKRNFREDTLFHIVKIKERYTEILSFSSWVGYGAVVQVGQTQCATLLVNTFFNTIMNTALSVANFIKSAILLFTGNLTKPIAPQITKSYSRGDYERCTTLIIVISKLSFLVTYIISLPFLLETKFIVNLWLGKAPEYSLLFSKLVIVEVIINSFNSGISEYVFATGNIKPYQLLVNTFLFMSIIIAYIVLKSGMASYSLLVVYIAFAVIALFLRQIILHRIYHFDNSILFKRAYLPSVIVVIASIPLFFNNIFDNPILNIILDMIYTSFFAFLIGTNKQEKNILKDYIIKSLYRLKR